MRRLTMLFVAGCAVLGIGLGLFLNSGRSSHTAADRTPATTSTTAFRPTRTTVRPSVEGATATRPPGSTTTTRPRPTTTTTAQKAAAVTTTTAKKAPKPTTPTTARRSTADCGSGTTTATTTGTFDPTTGVSTVTASIDNQNTKAVDIDAFVVHLVYSDGTEHEVTVPGAAGSQVSGSTSRAYDFTDQAPAGATLTSMDVKTFAYHVDGQPTCSVQ